MMSLKRVLAADTIQVVRRIDWIPPEQTTGGLGFTYDMYRHDYSPTNTASSGATSFTIQTFMSSILTIRSISAFITVLLLVTLMVSASTIEPTGTSTSIITTADGYRWKYVYTIPVAQVLKFFSADYMPVFSDASITSNAVAGEIDTVIITSSGSGYNNGTYDNVSINGDGTGGRVSIVVDGGRVISATVTSGGTGYSFGKVTVDAISGIGTGTGGQIDVIIPPPVVMEKTLWWKWVHIAS